MQGLSHKIHPQRYALTNELHARPFSKVDAPSSAACIALTSNGNAKEDKDHLKQLLDRFGASHPSEASDHHSADLGFAHLKWERHSEFVTYTLLTDEISEPAFGGDMMAKFPADWLDLAPGQIITSMLFRIEGPMTTKDAENTVRTHFRKWFVAESLAQSWVLDKEAVIASDFRIDAGGHIRFVILAVGQVGQRRLGRILQRLIEIETYKAMSMLTLPVARSVFSQIGPLNSKVSALVRSLADHDVTAKDELEELLFLSAEIEALNADHTYRFSAAEAYGAIVNQRVEVLREDRILGGQTFAEFMMRRYDPAMRTCTAARKALVDISARAARASDLLSTRVNVRTNEQNRDLLGQMDSRAALQLRLQETVEGLSVVAISYYASILLATLAYPVGKLWGLDKAMLSAILIPPVVVTVWWLVRRIKKKLHPKA